MKEDRIPTDAMGRPDLAHYTEPVRYYEQMFETYLASFGRRLTPDESRLAWKQHVHASWGLRARGSEAIPYAMRLLRHSAPEAREVGAGVLEDVGGAPGAADALLAALQAEDDDVARTAIVEALGKTASPAALDALQRLRRESTRDADLLEAIDRSIARLVV